MPYSGAEQLNLWNVGDMAISSLGQHRHSSAISSVKGNVMIIKSGCLSFCLVVSLLALLTLNACAPSGGTFANPQVKGDHSTISGDSAATADRKAQ